MYQIKKTIAKAMWISAEVILAGIASVYGNSPYYLSLVPLMEALRNYIKHRNIK